MGKPVSTGTPNLYDRHDTSGVQRTALATGTGAWLALTWWLVLSHALLKLTHHTAISAREVTIAVALSIYYLRLLVTWFAFLKRGLGWAEVGAILPWLLIIDASFIVAAAANPRPLGIASYCGIALFLLGSWMNSFAEFERNRWKRRPENAGRLYTYGLFRLCRHPNYLGDLIWATGLCLVSGVWLTAAIPLIMFCGFVFANIPALDAHLRMHYGEAFNHYAEHTSKLIPFLY